MSTGVIQEERTFHPYKMMHRIAIRVNTQLTLIAKKCKDTPSAWLTKYAFEKWCKEIEVSRAPARNYMIQQRIEGIEWFVTDMHSHQQIAHTVKKDGNMFTCTPCDTWQGIYIYFIMYYYIIIYYVFSVSTLTLTLILLRVPDLLPPYASCH